MNIKVNLFAALKDAAGAAEISLPWRQGMTCRDILLELKSSLAPAAFLVERSFVAVNGNYAEPEKYAMPEDEIAVLPPVSGG